MLAFLVAQLVKNLPAMWETCVGSLGGEDPLEEGMATHSSILCWENPHGQRSLVGYSPWGHKGLDMTERLSTLHAYCFFLHLRQKTRFPLLNLSDDYS